MAGEVTQLGNAVLPTGYFEIPDKTAGAVDKVAVDTLLAILTETPNGTEIESFDFWTPGFSEAKQLTVVLPFSFDTLAPVFADVATPPIITGTFPVTGSETFVINIGDVANAPVQISDPEKSATDTLTVTLTEGAGSVVQLGVEKSGTDTLTPVITEVFQIIQFVPFETRDATDALAPTLAETATVFDFSADVDRITITSNPVGYIKVTPR